MKCLCCKTSITKNTKFCPNCSQLNPYYSALKFTTKHILLIALAIIQALVFVVFLIKLFNGDIVRSYLKKGEYDKAVKLIRRYDTLADNKNISKDIEEIISDMEEKYISEKISYDEASSTIKKFYDIAGNKFGDAINEKSEKMSALNEKREKSQDGDSALNKKDYASAIEYYDKMDGEDNISDESKKDKLNELIDTISADMEEYAKNENYSQIYSELDSTMADCTNEDVDAELLKMQKKYLSDWITYKKNAHDYVGNESVYDLSRRYDALEEGSDLASKVDGEFKNFVQDGIDKGNYSYVLEILDNEYPDIVNSPESFEPQIYNDYRVLCASRILDDSKEHKKYTGPTGAIVMADKLNSYQPGYIDSEAIVREYTDQERPALVNWINSTRAAAGLSTLAENPKINEAAYDMTSNIVDNSYDDNTLFSIMDSKQINYKTAYCAWNEEADSAGLVAEAFDPISDFGILTAPDLKEIGIGIRYDHAQQHFVWFIIET